MEAAADSLLTALQGCGRILLSGPVGPDGDSLGACLALQRVLEERGLEVDVTGVVPVRYQWMPGADAILGERALDPEAYDAVVILDGDRHRLTPKVQAAFVKARVQGLVDHHASSTLDGYTHPWLDPAATSTCQMIYEQLPAWGVHLDAPLATLLYVGAIFDTGGFRYSNTRPSTHQMAAALLETGIDHAGIALRVLMERRRGGLRVMGKVYGEARFEVHGRLAVGHITVEDAKRFGIVPGDLEGVVDGLVHTAGVEVGVLLIERAAERVKVSLRSRGRVDVAAIAQELSDYGGGHVKAAGAVVSAPLAAVEERVVALVAAALDGEAVLDEPLDAELLAAEP